MSEAILDSHHADMQKMVDAPLKKDKDRSITSRSNQYLTFTLANEIYGIDILRVQEIRGWEKPSGLPNMPSYVKGVINMRGLVVPIVDLRERFNVGVASYDESTVVIITRMEAGNNPTERDEELVIGMVVDSVSDVYDVDLHSLQSAPSFNMQQVSQDFIQGLATLGDKMVIILDVSKLVHQGLLQQTDESAIQKIQKSA